MPNQNKRDGKTDQHSQNKLMELEKKVQQESKTVANLKQVYITRVRVPWEGCNVTANYRFEHAHGVAALLTAPSDSRLIAKWRKMAG